jgi:predicted outer membrane repeat protein
VLAALLSCGALSFTIVAPPAAGQSTIAVTNTNDHGDNTFRDVLEDQITDDDTVVLTPGATYVLDDCNAGAVAPRAAVAIMGNGATIEMQCDSIIFDTEVSMTFDSVVLTGGRDTDGRGGALHSDAPSITFRDSAIIGNSTCGDGGALFLHDGNLMIVNSTIAGNSAARSGGAIAFDDDDPSERYAVTISNSTISDNTAKGTGGLDLNTHGDVRVIYSTIVGNAGGVATGPECTVSAVADAAEIGSSELSDVAVGNVTLETEQTSLLETFGSVIALATGGPNCYDAALGVPLNTTACAGYNYSDDASCGIANPNDRQSMPNPLLGALGAIPVQDCAISDDFVDFASMADERGVARPQGPGCDIGAVEVIAVPIVQQPNFTG